jgi:hypothetical protein
MRRVLAPLMVLACLSVAASSQQVQPGAARSGVALPEPTVVVVDTGPNATALYHRETCAWLKGAASTRRFVTADAKKRYFQPHCLCIVGQDATPPCGDTHLTDGPTAAVPPAASAPAFAVPTAPRTPAARVAPASTRCQATTKKGTQCSRNAQAGRSFCWQH